MPAKTLGIAASAKPLRPVRRLLPTSLGLLLSEAFDNRIMIYTKTSKELSPLSRASIHQISAIILVLSFHKSTY